MHMNPLQRTRFSKQPFILGFPILQNARASTDVPGSRAGEEAKANVAMCAKTLQQTQETPTETGGSALFAFWRANFARSPSSANLHRFFFGWEGSGPF